MEALSVFSRSASLANSLLRKPLLYCMRMDRELRIGASQILIKSFLLLELKMGPWVLAKDTIPARKCNAILIDQNYAVGEAMEAARGWYFGQCSSKQHLSFEYSITTRQLCQVPSYSWKCKSCPEMQCWQWFQWLISLFLGHYNARK
jgi:hypothetical protein